MIEILLGSWETNNVYSWKNKSKVSLINQLVLKSIPHETSTSTHNVNIVIQCEINPLTCFQFFGEINPDLFEILIKSEVSPWFMSKSSHQKTAIALSFINRCHQNYCLFWLNRFVIRNNIISHTSNMKPLPFWDKISYCHEDPWVLFPHLFASWAR